MSTSPSSTLNRLAGASLLETLLALNILAVALLGCMGLKAALLAHLAVFQWQPDIYYLQKCIDSGLQYGDFGLNALNLRATNTPETYYACLKAPGKEGLRKVTFASAAPLSTGNGDKVYCIQLTPTNPLSEALKAKDRWKVEIYQWDPYTKRKARKPCCIHYIASTPLLLDLGLEKRSTLPLDS